MGMPVRGMDLDLNSGIFSWENPIASSTLVRIQVQATNELSRSDPVELTLRISPSYFVRVSTATVSYTRPSPAVYFDCFTVDMSSKGPVGGKPAVLWILEQGISEVHRRKVTVKTNSFGINNSSISLRPELLHRTPNHKQITSSLHHSIFH